VAEIAATGAGRAGMGGIYDAAVIGGGLIGAAAALGLARQGWKVLLVEPVEPAVQSFRLGIDLRTVAVSPATRELLERLEVWRALEAAPYRRMEVWEERGTRAMEFDAADVSRQELGWILENGPATAALWASWRRHEGVTWCADRVTEIVPGDDEVTLVAGGKSAMTRLLVAADGAQSVVRERLRVPASRYDTGHVALATVIRSERPHDGGAYQRFLLDGPVALLPTRDPRHSAVVWSQSPESAERRAALSDGAFCAELERAVQGRLGAIEDVDRRVLFPLRQQLAASFNPHPRVLLIGDAARVLHPLAGLGANVGFEDVRELLAVLEDLPAAGGAGDPGMPGLWRAFARRRMMRARLMLRLMDTLRRAYAQGDPLSQWLRNLGVGWLNQAGPVKRQIIKEAMGLGPVARGAG
jgi:2-polyprenylphenol 6-hydroxylase